MPVNMKSAKVTQAAQASRHLLCGTNQKRTVCDNEIELSEWQLAVSREQNYFHSICTWVVSNSVLSWKVGGQQPAEVDQYNSKASLLWTGLGKIASRGPFHVNCAMSHDPPSLPTKGSIKILTARTPVLHNVLCWVHINISPQQAIYPVSAMISGATYVGVPQTVYRGPSTIVARPKSPSFRDLLPSWCS